jgi:hypothetical protein
MAEADLDAAAMRLRMARAALKRLLDEPTAIRPAASLAAALNPELAGGSTVVKALAHLPN